MHLPWSKLAVVNFTSPKALFFSGEKTAMWLGAMLKTRKHENVSYIIHNVALTCFYHIYIYGIYIYVYNCILYIAHYSSLYFPACSGFVNNVFALIFGKKLSSELQHKPWISLVDALAAPAVWATLGQSILLDQPRIALCASFSVLSSFWAVIMMYKM